MAAEHARGACAQRPPGKSVGLWVGPRLWSARARRSSAPTFSRPPAREGPELSGVVSCLRASLCLSLAPKESSVGIDPVRLLVYSSEFGARKSMMGTQP